MSKLVIWGLVILFGFAGICYGYSWQRPNIYSFADCEKEFGEIYEKIENLERKVNCRLDILENDLSYIQMKLRLY